MAEMYSPQQDQEALMTAAVANDPVIQQIMAETRGLSVVDGMHVGRGGGAKMQDAYAARLAELGIDPNEYHLDVSSGTPRVQKKSWMDRHGSKLPFAATAALGGWAALPALTGGGAAAGGAAAGSGAAGGTGAAAGGGGLWSSILGTGGAGGLLSAGGDLLGGITQGMTDSRTEADRNNILRDQILTQQAGMQTSTQGQRAQIQMQQQDAAQREQADAYRKTILGQMAQNVGDVSLDRSGFQSDVPTISFSGGLRPSVIGEAGRTAGATLSQQALDRLMNPTQAEALPTYTPPAVSEPTGASIWERILSPVATGLTAAGNLGRVQPTTAAPPAQRVG